MTNQSKSVAQIWRRDKDGKESPYSQKFYSKAGVALNVAASLNQKSTSTFFIKNFYLEYIGSLETWNAHEPESSK